MRFRKPLTHRFLFPAGGCRTRSLALGLPSPGRCSQPWLHSSSSVHRLCDVLNGLGGSTHPPGAPRPARGIPIRAGAPHLHRPCHLRLAHIDLQRPWAISSTARSEYYFSTGPLQSVCGVPVHHVDLWMGGDAASTSNPESGPAQLEDSVTRRAKVILTRVERAGGTPPDVPPPTTATAAAEPRTA